MSKMTVDQLWNASKNDSTQNKIREHFDAHGDRSHPSKSPPSNDAEAQEVKAQVREMQQRISEKEHERDD